MNGRATTGPGEATFMKFEAAYNDLKHEIDNVQIREFDWEQYTGTPVYEAASEARDWGIEALGSQMYPRDDQK